MCCANQTLWKSLLTLYDSTALIQARHSVKEARAEILALEKEAEADAKAAKLKQKAAHALHKDGSKLGRHGA